MGPRTLQETPVEDEDAELAVATTSATRPARRIRRGPYISESILERRRRMLEVAKAMIAEGGSAGFTIRELGRRAKVSVTTIYATYGDKEGLIAAAIQDYYDGLPLARARPTASLPGVLAATDLARDAILANKPYARQYAGLYFSGTLDARIYKAIQETATASAGQLPWLQKIIRDGDLLPGLDLGYIVTLLANQRLMILHEWAQGRIKDEDLSKSSKVVFLIMMRGLTGGQTHGRLEIELKKLLRAGGARPSEQA